MSKTELTPSQQAQMAFHVSGRRPNRYQSISGMIPASMAPYRDLTCLRYDFPIVLIDDAGADDCVQSLSGLVDRLEGLEDRQKGIRTEKAMRKLGAKGRLSELWTKANPPGNLFARLKADGEVVDCDKHLPARLLKHLWKAVQTEKSEKTRYEIDRLIAQLSDILSAERLGSKEGRSAESLRAAMGSAQADAFDFDRMSHLLVHAGPCASLSPSRRRRVENLLGVLVSQKFFGDATYTFEFDSVAEASHAYRERLSKAVELAKALAVARLEVEGQYRESIHDPVFNDFGIRDLGPEDSEKFPDYLICLKADKLASSEQARLDKAFDAGLPFKVLVQIDDLIETGESSVSLSVKPRQLVQSAIAMGDVFTLQAAASALYGLRNEVLKGLRSPGSALFSIYSGAGGQTGKLAPYLVAAAAQDARVFPSFVFNPSAGEVWSDRFDVTSNPQKQRTWPSHELRSEDAALQRKSEALCFTAVDFMALDARFAAQFAIAPKADPTGSLAPLNGQLLKPAAGSIPESVPFVFLVDATNTLQRAIVSVEATREARRVAQQWRSLQELGGIENSWVAKALEKERTIWEERLREAESKAASAPLPVVIPVAEVAPSEAETIQEPEAATEEKPSDEPWIETPRCTSCNECTLLNPRMFGYNENKQAFIADITAGTYAQLVEAAENCQVSIIHPGKPKNSAEPGLDDLIRRAAPFL